MKMKIWIVYTLVLFFISSSISCGAVSIIGGLTHQQSAAPGQNYKGSIVLRNTSTEPQEVKIYQTDYRFCFDGSNHYGPPGVQERSNADWISFNPHRLIISPNDVATINYTVNVPTDANLTGTYWSMLMVEGVPKSSRESSQAEPGKTKLGITQITRYGIQMITHIGLTGEPKLQFLDTKVCKGENKRIMQVDVENVGQRWLRPVLWVELYDEKGGHIGRFEGQKKRIFPNTSVRYKVDLSNVEKGDYKALVLADGGGDYIFGANYTLKFEK